MKAGAGALALFLSLVPEVQPQAFEDEARVGSERELYARVLRLAIGQAMPPSAIHRTGSLRGLSADLLHPWSGTLQLDDDAGSFRILRPHLGSGYNSSFAWQSHGGLPWRGRGFNGAISLGAAANLWRISARLEPSAYYAANQSFRLNGEGLVDDMRPGVIDLPQRFGDEPVRSIALGESFLRLGFPLVEVAVSSERIFWGPGVRHALLFSAQAPGFPHVSIGTPGTIETPVGGISATVIYARLEQSKYAPQAPTSSRFGTGAIASWTPPSVPITIGVSRFYHLPWPESFEPGDLAAPFGSLFFDAQVFAGGIADNQMASAFLSVRLARLGMEAFGEFGRNDRSADLRDLAVEPEHNAAWLAGILKTFAVDSGKGSFWAVRYEAASGRVSAIQDIGRGQATFYEHSPITQGHTHRGLLLGTPLIDRSGGSELALDRWSSTGRSGVSLLQRQMPADHGVGMPAGAARTQWDLSLTGLRFLEAGELSYGLGIVWDLNRFPGEDATNLHLSLGWRANISRSILPGR